MLLSSGLHPNSHSWGLACPTVTCAVGHPWVWRQPPQLARDGELGTNAPGSLSLGGGEGGRPETGVRLLFPACPGEPPSPRGELWKPHEGGGVCLHQALWSRSAHGSLVWFCTGCPTRLAKGPAVLQAQHGHLAEGKGEGLAPPSPRIPGAYTPRVVGVGSPPLHHRWSSWSLFPPSWFLSQTWPRTLRALVSVWAPLRDQISSRQTLPLLQPLCGDTGGGTA